MKRLAAVLALTALLVAVPAAAALADSACAGVVDEHDTTHGDHVTRDYVFGDDGSAAGGAAVPGGPGPGFHFVIAAPPGASFCTVGGTHSGGIYDTPGWDRNPH
jgi:hypothetical protein